MAIRQQPEVHDTFASEELVLLPYAKGCYHPLAQAKVAWKHSLTLRVGELSEHGIKPAKSCA